MHAHTDLVSMLAGMLTTVGGPRMNPVTFEGTLFRQYTGLRPRHNHLAQSSTVWRDTMPHLPDVSSVLHVVVDEAYPTFQFVEDPTNSVTVEIKVDDSTARRWKRVLDEYEGVREEIATHIKTTTGTDLFL